MLKNKMQQKEIASYFNVCRDTIRNYMKKYHLTLAEKVNFENEKEKQEFIKNAQEKGIEKLCNIYKIGRPKAKELLKKYNIKIDFVAIRNKTKLNNKKAIRYKLEKYKKDILKRIKKYSIDELAKHYRTSRTSMQRFLVWIGYINTENKTHKKYKNKMIKKFGKNYMQNKKIREKIIQTNLQRYGNKCSLYSKQA